MSLIREWFLFFQRFCRYKWLAVTVRSLALSFFVFLHGGIFAQDLSQIKKSKPFSFSGSLTLGSGLNLSSATSNPYNQNAYNLNFSPVIKIYNMSFPFTFYVTNNSKGINHPFNRIGVSPTWKWLKLHAGYRTLNVSPYLFSGRMVLGGGIEMTPKKFRFAFMGGQLSKAQREDTLSAQLIPTTYERYGFGGKIGFGTSKSYFDFLFFKGSDVLQSISQPVKSNVKAAENAATGISFSIAFSKRIVWQTSAVLSIYTRDRSALNYDSVLSNQLTNNAVVGINLSSQFLTAGESSLRYTGNKGGITFKYRRIDPDFKTMGIFYLQTDLSEYSLIYNRSFFKSKLSVNGNLLSSQDNIYRVRNTVTNRLNGTLNANLRVTKKLMMNVSLLYANMSQSFIKEELGDSMRMNLLNRMISGGCNYTNDKISTNQVIAFTASYNSLQNINPAYLYDFSSSNLSVNTSHKTTVKRNKTSFTEQIAVYKNSYGTISTQSLSLGESVGKTFLKDKLNTTVSVNYIYSMVSSSNAKSSINGKVGISYKPNKNNTLALNGSIQNNVLFGNGVWFSSFNIRYTLTFVDPSSAKAENKENSNETKR